MSALLLSHYSQVPLPTDPARLLDFAQLRDGADQFMKPEGLWLSVDGDDDWKTWCENSEFGLKRLKFRQKVTLLSNSIISADEARHSHGYEGFKGDVLHLDDEGDVRAWRGAYKSKLFDESNRYEGINWAEMRRDYDGIIIAPYQYRLRMAEGFLWYYGWDCASGCIWNKRVIESISEPASVIWPSYPSE